MATYSTVLAWRIPGTGEPRGPPSMGSHRVGHDWSDLTVAAAWYIYNLSYWHFLVVQHVVVFKEKCIFKYISYFDKNFNYKMLINSDLSFSNCPIWLWRRQWHPTPVFLPGKSHGWRSLVGRSPWGHEESDTTEQLHFHFSLSCTGEGNGNLLHCSCLENPRDGGAWWAAVYGVGHDWSDLAVAAIWLYLNILSCIIYHLLLSLIFLLFSC